MSTTSEQKITEMAHLYNTIVQMDHHKDRDCHWYINKTWSYGQPPKYIVRHYGYLFSRDKLVLGIECETCEQAEQELIKWLKDAIMSEVETAKSRITWVEEWDDVEIQNAHKVLALVDSWMKEQ